MHLTPEEIQKLPTILSILDRIAHAEERLRNDKRWGSLLSDIGAEDKFEIRAETPDGPNGLHPTSSTVNTFFRGQTEFHGKCILTLYRATKSGERDRIDIFIDRIRSAEFELLLKTHPFVKHVYHKGIDIPAKGKAIPIKVDYLGLAQHYELNTDLLDFTNDKWVAAFFAACAKVNGRYVPLESKGYGVIYSYTILPSPWGGGVDPNRKFTAIGLQPFPRPGEQKAYALKLEVNEDLNHQHGVKKNFFRHNYQAAEVIYNRMNQGKVLFPIDALEKKATKIRKSRKLSHAAFRRACANYPFEGLNDQGLMQACMGKGISFVDFPVVGFSSNLEDAFWKKWRNGGEIEFLSKLVYRRVF